MLPYFRRAEGNERFSDDYHGTEGPLGVSMPRGACLPVCHAFIRAAQEYGIPYNPDFNGKNQAGAGFFQLTQRNVRRSSTATAYLKPAETRSNLTVLTGTHATGLIVERGRVVGVRARSGRQASEYRTRREVLVASGAIGSARLLLLSGIGPAAELKPLGIDIVHDLPGVGRNLHDHLDLCVLAECSGSHSYDGTEKLHRSALAALQYCLYRTGPVTSSLFETGAFWRVDDETDRPDTQFHFGQGSGIEKGIVTIEGGGVTLNSAYVRPRSRGSVRLASASPDDAPLIDPNYWSDPHDLEMSLRGLEIARGYTGPISAEAVYSPRGSARKGSQFRRRDVRLRLQNGENPASSSWNLPHGPRRNGRGRPGSTRARAGRTQGLRQFGHAEDQFIEHKCAHYHDRGKGIGHDPRT